MEGRSVAITLFAPSRTAQILDNPIQPAPSSSIEDDEISSWEDVTWSLSQVASAKDPSHATAPVPTLS
jgi:hypothetical protein